LQSFFSKNIFQSFQSYTFKVSFRPLTRKIYVMVKSSYHVDHDASSKHLFPYRAMPKRRSPTAVMLDAHSVTVILVHLQSQHKAEEETNTGLVHKVSFPPLFVITCLLYPLAFHLQLKIPDMPSLDIQVYMADAVNFPLNQTVCAALYRYLYKRKSFGYATSYHATKP